MPPTMNEKRPVSRHTAMEFKDTKDKKKNATTSRRSFELSHKEREAHLQTQCAVLDWSVN